MRKERGEAMGPVRQTHPEMEELVCLQELPTQEHTLSNATMGPLLLRALESNPKISIFTADEQGKVRFYNKAFREMLGYSEAELTTLRVGSFFGYIPSRVGEYELMATKRDGSQLPVQVNVSQRIQGCRTFKTFVILDNSEHQLIQDLRESEERFRMLSENAPVMIWVLNKNKNPIYVNKQCLDLIFEQQAVLSEDKRVWWRMVLHPEDEEKAFRLFNTAFDARRNVRIEYRALHKDGTYHWILDSGVPRMAPDGSFMGYVGTCLDITERKKLEQSLVEAGQELEKRIEERTRELAKANRRLTADKIALKKAKHDAELANAAKSRFLATISHEIRTPIGAIMGFAEMIRNPRIGGVDREECIDTILRNGRHLLDLINDILDLSKVEAGQLKIYPEPVILNELISQVASLLKPKAEEKGLSLSVLYEGSCPHSIHVDPTRLRQILINVIGNAVKFTHRGNVVVTIKYKRKEKESSKLFIEVKDTGIGIGMGKRSSLFKAFSQEETGYAKRFEGTGLGLTLSRRYARAMGGDVVLAESQRGVGSRFVVSINLGEGKTKTKESMNPNVDEATAAQFQKLIKTSKLKGSRILLVEDGEDNQILFSHFLKLAGAEVDIASDGQMAVRMVREGTYNVVLMDIQIPRLDGYAATEQVRKEGFKKPVLALTAFAMKGEQERCFAVGCDDCLTKPIGGQALVEAVARWV